MAGKVDKTTATEIDKVVWRTLRDAGQDRPPVSVEAVLEFLRLHRHYYDLTDPTFLDKAKHRLAIGGQRLVEVVRKVKLVAALFGDEGRVVVDSGLPALKRDFPSCHEATHRILEWHKPFFYGDTAQELDEDYQQLLEAEANYGASALMLCGPVFDAEAKDTWPEWASVKAIARRYKKSMTCTLRRYVLRGPDEVMAALISTPQWKAKPVDQPERWRHFVPSPKFGAAFSGVTPRALITNVDLHSAMQRGGLVGDFTLTLGDDNGSQHEFRGETFFNQHYLLTLFAHVRPLPSRDHRIIVPERVSLPVAEL